VMLLIAAAMLSGQLVDRVAIAALPRTIGAVHSTANRHLPPRASATRGSDHRVVGHSCEARCGKSRRACRVLADAALLKAVSLERDR
jgi:hypothetical protein